MRLGIFGGAFDPPHVGHVDDAKRAFTALGLDRMLIIPSGLSPHKSKSPIAASGEDRLNMARIAFGGIEGFEISDMELRKEGKSYTADTVSELKKQYPNDELWFIMGSDMFLSFEHWYEPERITANAGLAFLNRGASQEELDRCAKRLRDTLGAGVRQVENSFIDISSTELRRFLPLGLKTEALPPGVYDYIQERGLYDTRPGHMTAEELLAWSLRRVDEKRGAHIAGVFGEANLLADLYGCDREKAKRAAALHDVTKAARGPMQYELCDIWGYEPDETEKGMPQLLHAKTGAMVAEKLLKEAPDVCEAVFTHTTGRPGMGLLDKIICLADYTEHGRDFPGVEDIRRLSRLSLDGALTMALRSTVRLLINKNSIIHPDSRRSLDWLESGADNIDQQN